MAVSNEKEITMLKETSDKKGLTTLTIMKIDL